MIYQRIIYPLEKLVVKLSKGNRRILLVLRPISRIINHLFLTKKYSLNKYSLTKAIKANELGINIVGYLTGEFGIGSAVRSLVQAIQCTNIPYVLNNVKAPVHRSQDYTFQNFSHLNPYPINLIHINANEVLQFINRQGIKYLTGKYNIGYWVWELSRFPEEWIQNYKYYNEIWVPSTFVLNSISTASPIPVVRIPHSISINNKVAITDRKKFGLSPSDYVFLYTFDFHSHFHRKNPLGLIRAFKKAFKDKYNTVILVIKHINHTYYPSESDALMKEISGISNIKIIDTHLSKDELNSLVASCDCYISLHRSEGFGLTIAEAMYFEKPVIATGYSGNMDFMNINNSFPVKYKLVEVGEKEYPPFKEGYTWAEPDINHAAELIQFVHENKGNAVEIGQKASKDIKEFLSPQAIGKEIIYRLDLLTKLQV